MIERKLYQVKECTEEVTPTEILETHFNAINYAKMLIYKSANELQEKSSRELLKNLHEQENSLCTSN